MAPAWAAQRIFLVASRVDPRVVPRAVPVARAPEVLRPAQIRPEAVAVLAVTAVAKVPRLGQRGMVLR